MPLTVKKKKKPTPPKKKTKREMAQKFSGLIYEIVKNNKTHYQNDVRWTKSVKITRWNIFIRRDFR